jgi:ABC-type Fe3+ transport system substrate-binding protein
MLPLPHRRIAGSIERHAQQTAAATKTRRFFMNTDLRRCIVPIILFAVLGLTPPAAPAGALDPYIEGAKQEGLVRVGITIRQKVQGKVAGQEYLDAFQKRYPFVKLNFKRIGGARERNRLVSEMSGGVINFDVATVSESMVPTIVDANLVRIVDWKKLGVPDVLRHPRNIGVSLRTPVYGIAYNRDSVSEDVAKKFTWETCTDPKWKGKTATDDRPQHLTELYYAWGKEKTLDYARRWAANKPAMEPSRSTGAQKLASGAYHMICGLPRRQVKDLQVYGGVKSIGIVYPEPVPVGIGDLVFVTQKAKSPNAAILFIAWTATEEAQTILDDVDFSGHPSFEGNEINALVKGKKVAYGSWEVTDKADDVLAEILQAMGYPVVR